jgi:hypothetical protein
VLSITAFCAEAIKPSTGEVEYMGNPGDSIKGQITIINPSDEEKKVLIYSDNNNEIENWIIIPQNLYTIKGFHKVVISYEINVPEDVEAKVYNGNLFIKEISNPAAKEIEHRLSTDVVSGSYDSTYLRAAAVTETNPLHIALAVFAIFIFSLGLAFAIKCSIMSLNRRKKVN